MSLKSYEPGSSVLSISVLLILKCIIFYTCVCMKWQQLSCWVILCNNMLLKKIITKLYTPSEFLQTAVNVNVGLIYLNQGAYYTLLQCIPTSTYLFRKSLIKSWITYSCDSRTWKHFSALRKCSVLDVLRTVSSLAYCIMKSFSAVSCLFTFFFLALKNNNSYNHIMMVFNSQPNILSKAIKKSCFLVCLR